jgi:L-threonylcarbamoyladenylate synthase
MEIIKCKVKNGKGCDLSDPDLERINAELKAGRLVVYPTETLYGLGANAFDETAVKHVFMIKKRPFDMPISIAVSDMQMLESVAILDPTARKLAMKFMPGPITLILTKKPNVPDIVTAATDEIGIRMPDHAFALRLIKRFGPITSTSANLHAQPDPTTVKSCVDDLGENVSIYIDCGKTKEGHRSTIVAVHDGKIELIRQGVIPMKQIEAALHG